MAEAIARHLADRGEIEGVGKNLFIASAGVAAGDGVPISEEAVDALRRIGIDHDGTSKRLTAEMVRKATIVLGMTEGHVAEIRRLLGPSVGSTPDGKAAPGAVRVELVDPRRAVEDPVGMGQAAYDRLAKEFMRLLPGRLAELLKP